MDELISAALDFTQNYFQNACCGHDFEHVLRVYENAKLLLGNESPHVDAQVVLLGAILHDVDDMKIVSAQESENFTNTVNFLESQNVCALKIEEIKEIISTVSYSCFLKGDFPKTIEGKILFDADKLDQIGAIAISRAFAYGAVNERKIFDKDKFPSPHFEGKYPNGYDSNINYIIEVLLNVHKSLYTKAAQKISEKRQKFMIDYLEEFFEETGEKAWLDYFFSKIKY